LESNYNLEYFKHRSSRPYAWNNMRVKA
jgi:hypothetical protein